jgi:hypothetical protein
MSTADFLTGGRALERIWLAMARLGISLQPMTAITLFWNRWLKEGGGNFKARHQLLLENAWRDYEQIFPSVDFKTEGHVMLFRFGIGPRIRSGTYRKDFKTLLKS